MVDRHRHRAITPRLPGDVKDKFQAEAESRDASMNAIVVDLIRWWLRLPGAKLPPRPPRHSG